MEVTWGPPTDEEECSTWAASTGDWMLVRGVAMGLVLICEYVYGNVWIYVYIDDMQIYVGNQVVFVTCRCRCTNIDSMHMRACAMT